MIERELAQTPSVNSAIMELIASDMAVELAGALRSTIIGICDGGPLNQENVYSSHEALWSELIAGEWHLVGKAESSGGAGLNLLDLSALAEEWGRHLLPLPFIPTVLINRWIGSATAPQSAVTFGIPTPESVKLGGLVPFADFPDIVGVLDISPFTTRPCDDLTENERRHSTLGLEMSDWCTSDLTSTHLSELIILGIGELVGCGTEMLAASSTYALERVQFGRPIAQNQAVQHRLADMIRDLEVARTALTWAANEPAEAARAAGAGFERIRRVLESTKQIHGGYGCTWEAGLHYYLRHLWEWSRLLAACGVVIPL